MAEIQLFSSKKELYNHLNDRGIITIQVEQSRYHMTRIGDNVFVFEPKCPHFDNSLANASISPSAKITCMWHNYQFDLLTGQESQRRCRQLKTNQATWQPDGSLTVDL
ncbi:Rieske (2Fe-2S) protein [Marinoscillum sp.]|uniref:Rieske (2Fe-2S) protein n=1 Tax=Marinoscillum sp. TaxID=2024838 RepID=UPI003BAB6CBF